MAVTLAFVYNAWARVGDASSHPAASADRYAVLETAKDLFSLLKLMQTNLTLYIKNRC